MLLTFVSAVSNDDMTSVLTAVQLLWVNLIMDTFAALALATDPPTEAILHRKPTSKKAPLITTNMWKMIIGQAIFQLVVTFILYFAGAQILGYDDPNYTQAERDNKSAELATMVFNTFVWMQIFNEFNNRRLDNKFNIFEGIHRNYFFIIINCIMVGAQVAIVFVGGKAFSITKIDGTQWAICIVLAILCLPWAILVRLFPDPWFARIAHVVGSPIAKLYRICGRAWDRLPSFPKRRGKPGKEEGEEQRPVSEGEVPEIVVESEKRYGGVEEVDLEAGRK